MVNGTTVITNQHLHYFTIVCSKEILGKEHAFPLVISV
jgi:hypothetical protein